MLGSVTGTPVELDGTFGPEVRFSSLPPGFREFPGPAAGLQFFGAVQINARTRVMTVTLHSLAGDTLHAVDLEPDAD